MLDPWSFIADATYVAPVAPLISLLLVGVNAALSVLLCHCLDSTGKLSACAVKVTVSGLSTSVSPVILAVHTKQSQQASSPVQGGKFSIFVVVTFVFVSTPV